MFNWLNNSFQHKPVHFNIHTMWVNLGVYNGLKIIPRFFDINTIVNQQYSICYNLLLYQWTFQNELKSFSCRVGDTMFNSEFWFFIRKVRKICTDGKHDTKQIHLCVQDLLIYCKDSHITPGVIRILVVILRIYFENFIFIKKHFLPT